MGFRIYHLMFDPDPYVSTVHRQAEAAQWAMVFINTTGDKLCVGAVAGEQAGDKSWCVTGECDSVGVSHV